MYIWVLCILQGCTLTHLLAPLISVLIIGFSRSPEPKRLVNLEDFRWLGFFWTTSSEFKFYTWHQCSHFHGFVSGSLTMFAQQKILSLTTRRLCINLKKLCRLGILKVLILVGCACMRLYGRVNVSIYDCTMLKKTQRMQLKNIMYSGKHGNDERVKSTQREKTKKIGKYKQIIIKSK